MKRTKMKIRQEKSATAVINFIPNIPVLLGKNVQQTFLYPTYPVLVYVTYNSKGDVLNWGSLDLTTGESEGEMMNEDKKEEGL